MSLATTPSYKQRHRSRGLTTLRRLKEDVRSAFSRHPQATLNASGSGPASSIYAQTLLSGNQIRVLHIRPSFIRSRQLECELKPVNLDDAPIYEALSYVWGIDPPSSTIVCNGQRLSIRPELSYALVRLRLKDTTRIIWADALCINQDNSQEKSHQVPLMGKIFSQASKVNVWLGRSDKNVIKQALECSKLIANTCREFSLKHDLDLNHRKTLAAVEVPITVFTPKVCAALEELFTRPLFSRVWCVQEVLLAQYALIVWGEQELPWKDIGLTAKWMVQRWIACEPDAELRDLLSGIRKGDVDKMYTFDAFGASLLQTLSDFRKFQSTDPRDKVYGLISLIRKDPDIGAIVPDYGKSAAQIFIDTALYSISNTKRLLVFRHVTHHPDYDGSDEYRSWAPRWDIPRDCTFVSHKPRHYSGPDAQFIVTKHSEGERLYLTGIFYAKVMTVDRMMDIPSNLSSKSDGLQKYHQVVDVYEGIDWNAPMSDVALPVLARTLTCGISTTNKALSILDDSSLCAHYEAFRSYLEWLRTPTAELDSLRGDALLYHDMLGGCTYNLRFFWTSEKDYGMGPACMREGDIVVVFYGAEAPFVLRPKGDKYLMLGEAYVDSIRNGEIMKEVGEGKRQEQKFCLI